MRKRRFLSLLLSLTVLVGLTIACFSAPAATALEGVTKTVVIDGNQVDENPANRFKGFGAINCNNTGNLLLDYKEEHPDQYWEMMNMLFNPETGAGISHVKLEMGNDTNTSSGTEPATMRSATERANVWRGMGFHFAQDAMSINPNVEISVLRWSNPYWVQSSATTTSIQAANYENAYKWYHDTAVSLYEDMGLVLSYIFVDRNESSPDVNWNIWFHNRMRADATFPNGENIIMVSDSAYTSRAVGDTITTNANFRAAIGVAAYHYNMQTSQNMININRNYNKEIWYAEGIAPQTQAKYRNQLPEGPLSGGPTGVLGVMNRYIGMYTHGRRTFYIFQPAISAMYSSVEFTYKEIIGARNPWSGYYEPDVGLWAVMHFTQFAGIDESRANRSGEGWYIAATFDANGMTTLDSASDCNGNVATKGSAASAQIGDSAVDSTMANAEYNRMTYVSPDKQDFSTVMVNDSSRVAHFEFVVKNVGNAGQPAQLWVTAGPDSPDQEYDANFYKHVEDVAPVDNGDGTYSYFITVKAKTMASLTTTTVNPNTGVARTEHTRPETPKDKILDMSTPENPDLLYEDDFEYAEYPALHDEFLDREMSYVERRGGSPRYFADQAGALEVAVGRGRGGGNAVMQQLTVNPPIWGNSQFNTTLVGDDHWSNYKASIDFNFNGTTTATAAALLGVRVPIEYRENAVTNTIISAGYKLRVQRNGAWSFYRQNSTTAVASGTIAGFDPAIWHTMSVQCLENVFTFWLDGNQLGTYTAIASSSVLVPMVGHIFLGSTSGYQCLFDNLKVEKVEGYAPYFHEFIDDMDPRVTFSGSWNHEYAGAAAGGTPSPGNINGTRYNRTRSVGTAGASVIIPFTGSGFHIIGETGATSNIAVYVDGAPVTNSYPVISTSAGNYTGYRTTSYSLVGLPYGDHELRIVVNSGTFRFDAIGALVREFDPFEALHDAMKAFEALSQFDYTPETWAVAEAAYGAAVAFLGGSDPKPIDQYPLADALLDAIDALVPLEFGAGSQPVSVVLRKGMTYQLKIESNSPSTLFFISSNANATVNATGLVTAAKTGSAVITVLDVYAQRYFTVTINITS